MSRHWDKDLVKVYLRHVNHHQCLLQPPANTIPAPLQLPVPPNHHHHCPTTTTYAAKQWWVMSIIQMVKYGKKNILYGYSFIILSQQCNLFHQLFFHTRSSMRNRVYKWRLSVKDWKLKNQKYYGNKFSRINSDFSSGIFCCFTWSFKLVWYHFLDCWRKKIGVDLIVSVGIVNCATTAFKSPVSVLLQ